MRALPFPGALSRLRVSGEQTGGAFALADHLARRGNGSPVHVHDRDDETFFVLDGELLVFVGEEEHTAGPGTAAVLPRRVSHAYVVTSPTARFLTLHTPAGSLQGYRVLGSFLAPLPGSHRALGLDPDATPQFTTTPGQVAFTPDGAQLIVTTKGNGNDIDVFGVGLGGRPSGKATINSEPGTVPFAISFDPFGHLVIAEAGTNALSTFQLSRNGTVSLLDRTPTGQAATCWVTTAGSFLFASNAGSPSESGFTSSASGQLTLLEPAAAPGQGCGRLALFFP